MVLLDQAHLLHQVAILAVHEAEVTQVAAHAAAVIPVVAALLAQVVVEVADNNQQSILHDKKGCSIRASFLFYFLYCHQFVVSTSDSAVVNINSVGIVGLPMAALYALKGGLFRPFWYEGV